MLYVDARLSLADNLLLYGDKLSMAVSLEARVPLLDLELMRFVESIPPRLKIRGLHAQVHPAKRSCAKWVPEEVLKRKKIPFQSPIDRWFRTDLTAHLEEVMLAGDSACTMYFRPETVAGMVRDHVSGRHDHKRALLSLLVFELWYDQFIKPSAAAFQAAVRETAAATEGAVA